MYPINLMFMKAVNFDLEFVLSYVLVVTKVAQSKRCIENKSK